MKGERGDAGAVRARRVSAPIRCGALTVLIALGAALLCSSPAFALSQQGHEFSEAFGQGQLTGPTALAVNDTSGDVYVLDSAANRVVVFGPKHEFLQAWGFGVGAGSGGYEVCSSGCKPGVAGYSKGQFDDPPAIAVDNAAGSPSKGDVYVVANRSWKRGVIDKFSPTGEAVATLLAGKQEREEREEGTAVVGVATDSHGNVWVEREDEAEAFIIQRFNDARQNEPVGEPIEGNLEGLNVTRPVRPGFAIGANGEIYVTYEPRGLDAEEQLEEEKEHKEEERERKHEHEPPLPPVPQPCEAHACFVAEFALHEEAGEAELEVVSYGLDSQNSTGVTADLSSGAQLSGDVYVDNATSIAAFTAGGSLVQRFGSEQLTDGGGAGVAVDAATHEVLVADKKAAVIDAYAPSKPGPPVIETHSLAAGQIEASSARLSASIDPDGEETEYRFRYCAEGGTCLETPPAELLVGFGDQPASADIAGLAPETTYTFSVIAKNGSAEVTSEERRFTTSALLAAALLPDGRAWELVTPAHRDGATVLALSKEGGLIQAAADGKAMTYVSTAALGENEPAGNRGPEPSQILAVRGAHGWTAQDLATPNKKALGALPGEWREYQMFSSDLESALVHPHSEAPLSTLDSESTLYLRQNLSCASEPESCFQPLVSEADENPPVASGPASVSHLDGATADLRHVVLTSTLPLLEGAPVAGREGLYEWSAGNLALVSVLPSGEAATEEVYLGAGYGSASFEKMMATAISRDGSRVVWRTKEAATTERGHLYLREVAPGSAQTLQVDAPNTGVTALGEAVPTFQGASADGSKVFFTDPQRLTENAPAEEGEVQNLYVFEAEKPAGERLRNLSVPLGHEGAGVDGAVLGISEDGSEVYFVANGALAQGATPGGCEAFSPPGVECNLYVEHYSASEWEAPQLLTRLSSEDSPDWGSPSGPYGPHFALQRKTSEVSGNGEYLTFMSDRSLTGYDNVDARSGAADEEVFLYHYAGGSGALVCASCNPSGEQPVGVHDIEESGEGAGLLVDRPGIWQEQVNGSVAHWLSGSLPGWTADGQSESFYQSRYLDDSGRLFFDSSDSLVHGDKNGKEDVYEYEPVGVGSCSRANTEAGCVALISSGSSETESAFLDASEGGSDVFFLTGAKLVSQPLEGGDSIYDARVCKAQPGEPSVEQPCPTVAESTSHEECASEETCKAAAPNLSPLSGTPASFALTGSGNLPGQTKVLGSKETKTPPTPKPTTAQKLAKALKTCRKDKNKKKRIACEKQAHKRYRVKTATKAQRASSKPGAHTTRMPEGRR